MQKLLPYSRYSRLILKDQVHRGWQEAADIPSTPSCRKSSCLHTFQECRKYQDIPQYAQDQLGQYRYQDVHTDSDRRYPTERIQHT